MQKYLLSLAAAALAFGTMSAADVTLSAADATDVVGTLVPEKGTTKEHYQPVESLKIGGYSFTFKAAEEATDSQTPALYHLNATATIRLYKGCEMTIAFPAGAEVGSIVWDLSNIKGTDNITANTGEVAVNAGDKVITWNNSAKATSVTFTLPNAKGADGNNPNVQIKSFTVSASGATIEPTPDPTPAGNHVYAALETGCDWTYNNVVLPEGSEFIWAWSDQYGLKATAYINGTAYASEAWAISPAVELPAGTVTATFDHAAKFQTTLRTLCGFYIREVGGQWVKLTIPTWPEAGSWSFVNAGTIDLNAYAGKKVEFAFLYASDAAGADTWDIKNFYVDGDSTNVVELIDENVPAVYFDLNGRRVAEPANGLFIKVQGNKASKVIIK